MEIHECDICNVEEQTKRRHEDNVAEIERLRRKFIVLSENYDRLSNNYQNYKAEVERDIENCKNEVAKAQEKLKNVNAENERLKEINDISIIKFLLVGLCVGVCVCGSVCLSVWILLNSSSASYFSFIYPTVLLWNSFVKFSV